RESLPPAKYLTWSYYEIWIAGLSKLLLDRGLATKDEIASGRMQVAAKKVAGKLFAKDVATALAKGGPTSRENMHPTTHTRLPRYLRGHEGEIMRLHGTHIFPDTNAHGKGEHPQALYTVRFSTHDIWGEPRHPRDTVSADLWESYLDPA
ncbi:MAG: nitrile hydratase subunit beta, partial [Alphaproteobacteria bacterium]